VNNFRSICSIQLQKAVTPKPVKISLLKKTSTVDIIQKSVVNPDSGGKVQPRQVAVSEGLNIVMEVDPVEEFCCIICENKSGDGDMIKCGGICQNWFHKKCLQPGQKPISDNTQWKCEDCATGRTFYMIGEFYNHFLAICYFDYSGKTYPFNPTIITRVTCILN